MKIDSTLVHNYTVRLGQVSNFVDNQPLNQVRDAMENRGTIYDERIPLKPCFTFEKDEVKFKIWFLELVGKVCPASTGMTFQDAMEMTWVFLCRNVIGKYESTPKGLVKIVEF